MSVLANKRNSHQQFEHQQETVLVKTFVGDDALERRDRERRQLIYWSSQGFNVPKVYDSTIDAIAEPHLVTENLNGQTLRSYFQDSQVSLQNKLDLTEQLFVVNKKRHLQVLQKGDEYLIHYDSNTGNILLTNDGLFHIDFEAPFSKYTLEEALSNEIAKLIRWIANDMGKAYLPLIIERLVKTYADSVWILKPIVRRTLGSPLQSLHRFRDGNVKDNKPEQVTKYDIADVLFQFLSERNFLQAIGPFPISIQKKSIDSLRVSRVYRHLAGKRFVGCVTDGVRSYLIKVFYDKSRAKQRYFQEKSNVDELTLRGVKTQQFILSGKLPSEGQGTIAQYLTHRHESYYIMYEFFDHAVTVKQAWLNAEDESHKMALFEKVLMVVCSHHQKGVVQTDLHFGNFLLVSDEIVTIDGDTIMFQPKELNQADSSRQLGILLAQATPVFDKHAPLFIEKYYSARGWQLSQVDIDAILEVRDRTRALAKVNRLKKVLRDCTEFAAVLRPFNFFVCDRTYLKDFVGDLYQEPDRHFPADASQWIKNGKTASVARFSINNKQYIIKRYNTKSFFHLLKKIFKPSRARRSWQNANLLKFYGIPTAAPIALFEKTFGLLKKNSYFIAEYLDAQHLLSYLTAKERTAEEINGVLQKCIALFQSMKTLKITHGDLKFSNILICDGQPVLVDLDALQQHRCEKRFERYFSKDIQRFIHNFRTHPELEHIVKEQLSAL